MTRKEVLIHVYTRLHVLHLFLFTRKFIGKKPEKTETCINVYRIPLSAPKTAVRKKEAFETW